MLGSVGPKMITALWPFLCVVVAFSDVGAETYDERTATKYVWVAQATGYPSSSIKHWTGGRAFDQVKEVHNVHVTDRGFPLDTLGVVAEYKNSVFDHDCIVAFRGSKNVMNYLLDDGNAIMVAPYKDCPGCRVHEGFFDSWQSLKNQTVAALKKMGCDKVPIRVTGHSLGGAMAALAAFDLVTTHKIKHVYTLGQPRTGNDKWVTAFMNKIPSSFRIVDYRDPAPRLPPQNLLPYHHTGPEVFYTATKLGSYHICSTGENITCMDQFNLAQCITHGCDHCSYLGMNPCDLNSSTPRCNESYEESTLSDNLWDRDVNLSTDSPNLLI